MTTHPRPTACRRLSRIPHFSMFGNTRAARPLPGKVTMPIRRGAVFQHELPGGGGWGDPLTREPARVLRDVRNGFVSLASARADYGVVVDAAAWTVDAAATERLRADLAAARGGAPLPTVTR